MKFNKSHLTVPMPGFWDLRAGMAVPRHGRAVLTVEYTLSCFVLLIDYYGINKRKSLILNGKTGSYSGPSLAAALLLKETSGCSELPHHRVGPNTRGTAVSLASAA